MLHPLWSLRLQHAVRASSDGCEVRLMIPCGEQEGGKGGKGCKGGKGTASDKKKRSPQSRSSRAGLQVRRPQLLSAA